MAYTKQTWACGDEITADKLSHMEDGIAEGSDHGYECVEDWGIVDEETVTTTLYNGRIFGLLSYTNNISGDTIKVVFEGTEYILPKSGSDQYGSVYYGEYENDSVSFANYPIAVSTGGANVLYTETAGTYTISISVIADTVTTSECFEKAVKLFTLKNVVDAENGGVISNNVSQNIAGTNAHAEGSSTASGPSSHAEGGETTAIAYASHAEGSSTTASGYASHAQNVGTVAQGESQTAIGQYNVAQGNEEHVNTDYIFIVGNGSSDNARSNAFAMKWDGTFVFANGTEITPAQFASLLNLLS